MLNKIQKWPFLLELFVNGTYILLSSLKTFKQLPQSWDTTWVDRGIDLGLWVVPVVLLLNIVVNYIACERLEEYLRRYIFSIIVFVPLVLTWGDQDFTYWLSAAHLLSTLLSIYDDRYAGKNHLTFDRASQLFKGIRLKPAQLILLSFSAAILCGTFLLMLPISAKLNNSLAFVDALFLATSATCVTGLATKSISGDLSLFGQIVVLVLIQIGGLSIMTLYSSLAILLGRSMGMRERVVMQESLEVSSLEDLFAMVMNIIKYTFVIELWGAVVLTIGFTFEGFEFSSALYNGIFHSVSAFCNAGFSLFDSSLENFATKPLITGTISILITVGGLGFIVLRELKDVVLTGKHIVRMSLHSKVVIITSFLLTLSGTIFFFFGEFLHALDGYTLWEKMQISIFQSVTLRTAGFNSIPLTGLHSYTLYLMTLFMFVGGSPGSTAGGVKTTTLAILIQSIITTMKGKESVSIFDRKIPPVLVVRATAITFISILITSFFILGLMRLESEQSFLAIFFEVISASGTVGLTLGITPYLSVFGKFAISLLMLLGRIGPLTMLLAIGQQQKSTGKFDYPSGRIMIG